MVLDEQSEPPFIYNFSISELEQLITSWGEPGYRARQIWEGLYQQLWAGPENFTNLPSNLRARLADTFTFTHLQPVKSIHSADNRTVKTLFQLPDVKNIEAVLMYYGDTGTGKKRRTLCISTQAGCAMGCVFCATGQMGFMRNLSSGEIIEQVLYYARILKSAGELVTNIVFMGMGEPFHNYAAVMQAVDQLGDPTGYNFGARRFTISTVGIVPAIRRFADERRQVNLAVSLHAAQDDLRTSMLPVNRKYPLDDLLAACRYYVEKTHRRITFEWALIQDVNDSTSHARLLAERLTGLLCHVNVIPLNPTHGYSGKATSRQQAEAFRSELAEHGIPCTVRLRRGIEIQAGCGQLAAEGQPELPD